MAVDVVTESLPATEAVATTAVEDPFLFLESLPTERGESMVSRKDRWMINLRQCANVGYYGTIVGSPWLSL